MKRLTEDVSDLLEALVFDMTDTPECASTQDLDRRFRDRIAGTHVFFVLVFSQSFLYVSRIML